MGEMDAQATQDLEARIDASLSAGDLSAAATEAIRGYGPQILGYLVAVMRDDEAAYDVFSQFSEDLWRGIGTFRRQCSFRTWAYKIAWNAALRFRRDAFRRRVRRLQTTEVSKIIDEVRSASRIYQQTAVKDRMSEIRASLDPDEQTLLILRVDRSLSWKEIAEIMSDGEGETVSQEPALRKRFERLKGKLRTLATEAGLL
jgi:RNA polymerase sigma-70 factor (ECF subfamily)